ncbi:EF-P lysine aminoacylase EpmA [Lentisphaerota bacterium WC36G]|nr:EF-P lysine aminoacylase GenX [Lentisphaerae bacterium WC36]
MNDKYQNLLIRSKVIKAVRDFFHQENFIEIETPVMISAPAPEEYIEAVTAHDNKFLRTSPELQMKELLCADQGKNFRNIFQIGSCFRAHEHGRKHREEFTMLEWYQVGADYFTLMKVIQKMVQHIAKNLFDKTTIQYQGQVIDLTNDWDFISVVDAFEKYANCDVFDALKNNDFDYLMIDKIEPKLGSYTPSFLYDYPASCASLSRLKKNDKRFAERFELYIAGVELANGFSELTDYEEQRKRFAKAMKFRESKSMNRYPEATKFLNALRDLTLPESAGCALGLDRLIMIFTDQNDIINVIHQ